MIYKGKVVKIVEFGAFVNFFGARDGLVHISQLSNGRSKTVSDVREGRPGSVTSSSWASTTAARSGCP